MNSLNRLMGYLSKLFTEDKLKHIIVSAVIMVILSLFIPKILAAVITLCIGIGKELYDKYSGKGCSEWEDLLSDVIGILIGIL